VLAKQKASSAEVKSFAEQMIQDHTKANQELEQLAKQKGITVPAALDNEGQAQDRQAFEMYRRCGSSLALADRSPGPVSSNSAVGYLRR
jgi:Domain of unknown function (DUF4142)